MLQQGPPCSCVGGQRLRALPLQAGLTARWWQHTGPQRLQLCGRRPRRARAPVAPETTAPSLCYPAPMLQSWWGGRRGRGWQRPTPVTACPAVAASLRNVRPLTTPSTSAQWGSTAEVRRPSSATSSRGVLCGAMAMACTGSVPLVLFPFGCPRVVHADPPVLPATPIFAT